ncbi:MAG: XRE family transcriptional regulator [Dysgonamonadaceae bacterium]|jgi:mannose-6-phosphate isomerase-like protein (cupin superfamily)|nr:XRE family transcriptional regulator [Dysgonamonadaceae bacterium]
MNEQIKQIAERLKGLRDSLELSIEEMAVCCRRKEEEIRHYESGETDIPMSFLFDAAQRFNIDTSTLISGEEPRMTAYFLTRAGKGKSVERNQAYKYQALASGFKRPDFEPFEVIVEPNTQKVHLNSHEGKEFDYVLEGRMLFTINNRELILNKGDSIYFDSSNPHGMKALDGKPVKFLAIIK